MTEPTINTKVAELADHQANLARLQDELKRLAEHVEEAECKDAELRTQIGVLALRGAEHPAVTFTPGDPPFVDIVGDLSQWQTPPDWCKNHCPERGDKCQGNPETCRWYPMNDVEPIDESHSRYADFFGKAYPE